MDATAKGALERLLATLAAFGMVLEPVLCPACQSSDIVKHGQSAEGKQRSNVAIQTAPAPLYIRHYAYPGYLPEVKQQIADMALNGSGIRDTARVLNVSKTTVIETLKKLIS